MKIKLSSLMLPVLVLASCTGYAQAPVAVPLPYEQPMTDVGNGGMQPPSPEEFAQWYQEVNKEVDQFKSTLSEDDRKQFDTEVENLTKVMTDILETEGPEGLDKFIESLFQAEAPMQAPMEEEVKAPVVEAEVKTPEKAKEPEVPSKSVDAAAKLVEDLIFHTERFLRKSEIIPELPGKIERWVEKGKIKEWKADVTWETLKGRIENLNKRFHDLQDRDPKTKQYKFMSHLVQQESLYNNMSHLLAMLTQHETKAEAPAFGLGKVTDKSRAALREVLSSFMEAIYKLEMPQQIEKLIEKYEPRAKELREEEDTSRKKAHEESKKPRIEGAKKETPAGESYYGGGAGYPGGYTDGGAGSYGDYQPYGGYTPGGYYDTSSPYQPGGYYDQGGESASGQPSEAKGGKEAGRPGTKGGKEETPTSVGVGKVKTDPSIKRLVDKVDSALDDVMEKVSESKLASIESHMTDGSAVDVDLAGITLPTVIRKFKSIIDQVKTIKSKANRISNAQQEQALQELRAIATGHKAMLASLLSQITTIKTKLPSIAADKQYAYFGGKSRDKASTAVVTKIPQPVSLQDLADAIEQFNTEVGPYGAQAEEGKSKTATGTQPRAVAAVDAATPSSASADLDEEEAEEGAPTTTRAAAPTRADLNRQAQKIDAGLEKAKRIIEDNAKLRNIQKHIADAGQPADATVIKAINDATLAFKDVGTKFEQFKKDFAAVPAAQQKAAQQSVEQVMTALQENPDMLESMGKQLTAITAPGFALSREKRYAYLGGAVPAGTGKVDAAALAKQFPVTASLKDLLDAMTAIYQPEEPEAKTKRATAAPR